MAQTLSPPSPRASFLAWNDALARHFFSPEHAGQPVYLDVGEELLERVGRGLGDTLDGLIAAVLEGPPWATRAGLCQRALQALDGWRTTGRDYPPYIAYLAVFVYAAGIDGNFAAHSYYDRLRTVLSMPGEGAPASFERMLDLWDDLEHWSTKDQRGELGVFVATIAGDWIHVGLPKSQSLLNEHERDELPAIFADAGLPPGGSPSRAQLVRALRTTGASRLRGKTLDLLRGGGDTPARDALLQLAADGLERWDGSVEPTAGGVGTTYAELRIALRVDRLRKTTDVRLRCMAASPFPEGGLALHAGPEGPLLTCHEDAPGWSEPLLAGESPLDAGSLDWSTDHTFRDDSARWTVRMRASSYRALVPAERYGFAGLIETTSVDPGAPFHLLFSASVADAVADWAGSDARGFKELPVVGLPSGWTLARCDGASALPAGAETQEPQLADLLRLQLVGGLRAAGGNNFFSFAPPRIRVEGIEESGEVRCNGSVLAHGAGVYDLPAGLPEETRIEIEAEDSRTARRMSLYLSGEFDWQAAQRGNGRQAHNGVRGALVEVPDGQDPDFQRHPLATAPAWIRDADRVFLVGRKRGEIIRFEGELPAWEAMWAIALNQKGRVYYCGQALEPPGLQPPAGASAEDLELWSEILWRRRKRLKPPDEKAPARLWRRYVEAAEGG